MIDQNIADSSDFGKKKDHGFFTTRARTVWKWQVSFNIHFHYAFAFFKLSLTFKNTLQFTGLHQILQRDRELMKNKELEFSQAHSIGHRSLFHCSRCAVILGEDQKIVALNSSIKNKWLLLMVLSHFY